MNFIKRGELTMQIVWQKTAWGWESDSLPRWRAAHMETGVAWEFTIEARPSYCDRGRYIVKCSAPLDNQEGWPRYYFALAVAKSEAEAWLNARKEVQ